MLILDTSVLRRPGLVHKIRRRHPSVDLAAPAVVVMELLNQVVKGEENARRALEPVARGEVRILPEYLETVRVCFDLPPTLPKGHVKDWKRLARVAMQEGDRAQAVHESWEVLARNHRIGWGAGHFFDTKLSLDFQESLRELVADQRRRLQEQRPRAVEAHLLKNQIHHAEALVHFAITVHMGSIRAWLLNQLCAAAGDELAERILTEKPEDYDLFSTYKEAVEPRYRGGLETLVILFESRQLPWLREQGKQPEQNDFWDINIFASVGDSPDQIVVTFEQAWLDAARLGGIPNKVVHPDSLLIPNGMVRGPSVEFGDSYWSALSHDPRVQAARGPVFTRRSLERWLRESYKRAATTHGIEPMLWWPEPGHAGQCQCTAWAWAFVSQCALELPVTHPGKMQLSVNEEEIENPVLEKRMLEGRWTDEGHLHSRVEILVDFVVSAWDLSGNPVLLTAESEMFPGHGVGSSMGRADDYTLGLYKLLLVQSPFRILFTRVGATGDQSELQRIDTLKDSLAKVMERYGHELAQGAELAAVLLPESREAGFHGIQIGTWAAGGWAWTFPSLRPTDIDDFRGAT